MQRRRFIPKGSASVASPRVVNISDLRLLAQRKLPRAVFDYLDGGAEAEFTLRENRAAFQEVAFRPRHAVSVPQTDLRTRVLGFGLSVPILLAPVGYSSLMHRKGEMAAARAAGAAGTAYILSTISGARMEDVRDSSPGPVFYQLYLIGGREASEIALERARVAGFSALVVTIDTAVAGFRVRDCRNGVKELLGNSILAKIPFLSQVIRRPNWLTRFLLDGGTPPLANVVVDGRPMPLIDVAAALAQAAVTWKDLEWIRQLWSKPIVIKGVLTSEDARRAIEAGADALVVSNHGGRQLDGVEATLRVLPQIVEAVNDRAEVLIDGGICSGSDVVKALCLGARAVLCGRAYAYGLAAAGESGVARALEILRSDMDRTLKLLGCPSVTLLDRTYVKAPSGWSNR